jgi:RNA ligase
MEDELVFHQHQCSESELIMDYKFPEIRTIEDVLPHIEGRSEFIVAEREFGTVINYMVSMADTFDMTGPDDLGGAIRRECRGLIFDTEGRIMSRPFHKFFNALEKEETQIHVIDMSRPHVIMEKMDGSMIRPVRMNGMLRLATKMGVTDIAIEAESLLSAEQYEWLEEVMSSGVTPLFEYIAPTNKIVIEYTEPKLVLLAMRNNISGNYYMPHSAPFEVVPQYGSVDGGLAEYITRAREMSGREGDIIRFADGHMVKIKNDWYVRIHKTKDLIRFDRNIADIIVNEQLDDVLPLLDSADLATVRAYELRFDAALENVLARLEGLVMLARVLHGGNKKEVAINFVPNLVNKEDASFIFSALDGKELRPLVINKIKGAVGNGPKYEVMMNWMEG